MGISSVATKPDVKPIVQEAADKSVVASLQQTMKYAELLSQLMRHPGYQVFQRELIRRFDEANADLRKAKTIEEMKASQAVLDALESVGGIVPAGVQMGEEATARLKELAASENEESDA